MGLPKELPYFTPEEYLDIERESEIRHEYLDGYVYAMAGESPEHSLICFNLSVIVGLQLRGKPCQGYSPNMKVRTDPSDLFSYPDLAIVCGEPIYHDKRRDVLLNPKIIFEVLSPSTEKYDRDEKFRRYRENIPSMTDYILVSQSTPKIEHFTKQDNGEWTKVEVSGLSNELYIASIDVRIPLEEVYENITFYEN
jgi:Uma2 family endonuclease